MDRLSVEAVEDRRELRAFLRLPKTIYRGDPRWVPPLRRDERARLSPSNPFFAHAEAKLFLVRQGGEVVGRAAAIVDRWHLERWKDGAGFFGFFECVDDHAAAAALFGAVGEWLRGKGLASVRGPFNPSTNDMCGILTAGFEHPPRIMMPYNPAYYPALFEHAGLRPVRELLAYELEPPAVLPDAMHRVAETAASRGCRIRPLDPRRLAEEAETFRQIYNTAWSENWGFVPMSQSEMAWMASQLRQVLVPDLALVAEWDGRPVGFFLLLPDVNPALRVLQGRLTPWGLCRFLMMRRRMDEARLVLLGVLPEYRRRGIEALLLRQAYGAVRRHGYRRVELGWILEENAMIHQMTKRWGAREVKRYRIYEGPL